MPSPRKSVPVARCSETGLQLDRWGFPIRGARLEKKPKRTALDLKFVGKSPKQLALLAALQELCRGRAEGQTFSNRQIARHCHVSPEYIRRIGRSGMRKLRNRLPPEVREAFEYLLSRERTAGKPKRSTSPAA